MTEPISFFVAGHPKTAGSKRAFMPKGWSRPVIVEDCKGSKDWRGDCKAAALAAYQGPPLQGPLAVTFTFVMPRIGAHRNSKGLVKPNAPIYHQSKPDVLKMARAVEDALKGILYYDDSQIAVENLMKMYGTNPGCEVTVRPLMTYSSLGEAMRERGDEALPLFQEIIP